jgi:hypothetical protein
VGPPVTCLTTYGITTDSPDSTSFCTGSQAEAGLIEESARTTVEALDAAEDVNNPVEKISLLAKIAKLIAEMIKS